MVDEVRLHAHRSQHVERSSSTQEERVRVVRCRLRTERVVCGQRVDRIEEDACALREPLTARELVRQQLAKATWRGAVERDEG